MQLRFFDGRKSGLKVGNFGDDLNPWMFPRLFPKVLDGNGPVSLVGIGTLINHHLPQDQQLEIFGSGVGYGKVPPISPLWNIRFVRGPLSSNALGLPRAKAITDPALLVRRFYTPGTTKKYRWSYAPHYTETMYNGGALQQIMDSLDIHLIDLTASVDQVLDQISASEVVLCEAMHGAIVADALRVPWVPVKTKGDILDFKWNDWTQSVDLPYKPHWMRRKSSILQRTSPIRIADFEIFRAQFALLKRRAKPILSKDSVMRELEEKLAAEVDSLNSLAAG